MNKGNLGSTNCRTYVAADTFRSHHVLDATMSAGCEDIVYQLSGAVPSADGTTKRQRNALWRLDPISMLQTEIADWAWDAHTPVLAPNGTFLLFLAMASADSPYQLYRLDVDTGSARALTDFGNGIARFALSPDALMIAFAAQQPNAKPRPEGEHVRISRQVYRFDRVPGYLQDCEQALYRMSTLGDDLSVLTEPDGLINTISFLPDGEKIMIAVAGARDSRRFNFYCDLHVVDMAGNKKTLLRDHALSAPFAVSTGLVFAGFPEGDFTRQAQLYAIPFTGDASDDVLPLTRSADLDRPVFPLVVCNNPSFLWFGRQCLWRDNQAIVPVQDGGEVGIYRIALDGEEDCDRIVTGQRVCRVLCVQNDTLLFTAQDVERPAELWSKNLTSGEECQLTNHHVKLHDEISWPICERVLVNGHEGDAVEGWVLRPQNVDHPLPTILCIHGGPHAGYGLAYHEDYHELVGAGYAVLFANPHGSTGYGDDFSQSIIGCWGEPEFLDFMALVDDLVARGIADPDRLGVTGVSGGGHLTAWLMTHTNRFKAAIPEQGVYNHFSFYGTSDAGVALATMELGEHPHTIPELYWRLSPIAHAHRCKTPALLIQGENDIRCPMEQAEQLYAVLKQNNCCAEMLRLQNCAHSEQVMGAPSLRSARMEAIKDWFDRFI